VRPLYLVGTQRDIGKTTLSIGLSFAFRARGLSVAYTKPLGQRVTNIHGRTLHDDAMVVATILGISDTSQTEMAVPLPKGRVEKEVFDPHTDELLAKVRQGFTALAEKHDVVVVESMGHVAMGSCLGLSSAEVARAMNARVVLVSGGGIGRAIDEISLCTNFLTSRGADLMGVVVNKVWPEKFERVRTATTRGLANLGITSFGTVPFEQRLSSPTVRQVYDIVGGELLNGSGHLGAYVENIIVAAMQASHMVGYLKDSTLVITPGDRNDNILAALTVHMLGQSQRPAVAGLILTGGFPPNDAFMKMVATTHLPVILVQEDTYAIATKLRRVVFKISPDSHDKIDAAVRLVAEYVDVDGILEGLAE